MNRMKMMLLFVSLIYASNVCYAWTTGSTVANFDISPKEVPVGYTGSFTVTWSVNGTPSQIPPQALSGQFYLLRADQYVGSVRIGPLSNGGQYSASELGIDTSDFGTYTFQGRIYIEATPPPQAAITSDDSITVTVFEMDIKDGNNNDITGTTQTTIVGRVVDLYTYIQPSTYNAENIVWLTGQNTVGGYSASTTSASPTPVVTDASTVRYYYISGGNQSVFYYATVGNWTDQSQSVTFDVKRPTATVTATTGVNPIGAGLHFIGYRIAARELYFGSYGNNGITFNRTTFTEPAGYNGGETQWWQTISTTRRKQNTAGQWYRLAGFAADDFPYSQIASCNDNPAQPLSNSYDHYEVTDSYAMYLMYKPSGTAIWVPLRSVSWNWAGKADRTGTDTYVLVDGSANYSANPPDSDCTVLPEWSIGKGSLSWQQE